MNKIIKADERIKKQKQEQEKESQVKYGGIGTVFWIWISTIFLIPISYYETKLGIIYRIKKNNKIIGGPQIYIEKNLKKKKLAIIYTLLIIIIYLISFISIQTNTIITSISYFYNNKFIIITKQINHLSL